MSILHQRPRSRPFGEGILPQDPPVNTPAPARRNVCRLRLELRGTSYKLCPLDNQMCPGYRAWSLRKPDNTTYHIADTPHGPVCDCPDFILRREGRDEHGCKHVRSLRACGLLDPSATRAPSPMIGRQTAEHIAHTSIVGHLD